MSSGDPLDKPTEEIADDIKRRGGLLPHTFGHDMTDAEYEDWVDWENDMADDEAPVSEARPLRRSGRMVLGSASTDPKEILRALGLPVDNDDE